MANCNNGLQLQSPSLLSFLTGLRQTLLPAWTKCRISGRKQWLAFTCSKAILCPRFKQLGDSLSYTNVIDITSSGMETRLLDKGALTLDSYKDEPRGLKTQVCWRHQYTVKKVYWTLSYASEHFKRGIWIILFWTEKLPMCPLQKEPPFPLMGLISELWVEDVLFWPMCCYCLTLIWYFKYQELFKFKNLCSREAQFSLLPF